MVLETVCLLVALVAVGLWTAERLGEEQRGRGAREGRAGAGRARGRGPGGGVRGMGRGGLAGGVGRGGDARGSGGVGGGVGGGEDDGGGDAAVGAVGLADGGEGGLDIVRGRRGGDGAGHRGGVIRVACIAIEGVGVFGQVGEVIPRGGKGVAVDGARRQDGRGVKGRDGRARGGIVWGRAKVVERVCGVRGEGGRERRVGGRGAARGRGARVIDIELHVVGVESAVLVGGGEEGGVIVVRGGRTEGLPGGGEGGEGEVVLGAAKVVDDDDVDILKVLHEGVEVVDLEAAARVVATLGGRGGVSGGRGWRRRRRDARAHRPRWRGR